MKRTATANWKGSGKEGTGKLITQSGVIKNKAYDFKSRFEDGTSTNPEELIAAAHAGCYSMKLSFVLGAAGLTPNRIETKCTVTLEGGVITSSHLEVKAKVAKCKAAAFAEYAADAKENCPVSKALNVEITMDAELVKSFKATTTA
ncbi:MAG: OsmC family peroxiredoxin [Chitinophagaceae bacterium]|nr:OsmC family peroxiredoxin [Chitinophagaceae bacterium]MBP6478338.1 OsmC family peroxiredoxin [Chitinophagaceae bacterium]MBP7107468.1 OsmC family peroxiredoxin [Chitinophagaceae bacterium]MBP7315323.1 OsmC family peroxiredoxin [Chitinophagaceae bacterium]HQV54664.1 OsmC family peroxiredoxin [Chitinophagaceae bacterium]